MDNGNIMPIGASQATDTRRISLVTGASRGLGKDVALALAAQGDDVIIIARDAAKLRALATSITAFGGSALVFAGDLGEPSTIERLARLIAEKKGRLDGLFLNAAVLGPLTDLTEVSDTAWSETLDTNLTANWRLLRALHPLLLTSAAGRVLAVSSGAAARPKAKRGPYAISKIALELLIKTYALEVAETRIRANLLDPGPLATDMRAAAVPGEDPTTLPAPSAVVPLILELLSPASDRTGTLMRFPELRERQASLEVVA